MNRTQNSPKRRQEKQLSARRKHCHINHMQVTDRPSPAAPSLTQANNCANDLFAAVLVWNDDAKTGLHSRESSTAFGLAVILKKSKKFKHKTCHPLQWEPCALRHVIQNQLSKLKQKSNIFFRIFLSRFTEPKPRPTLSLDLWLTQI